jgi:hypothetical protein
MENQGSIQVIEGNILERIRLRPPMFLGKHSLSALRSFLDGYFLALHESGVEPKPPLPNDFHDWVAYRLHFRESTSGYTNMILEYTPDEAQALIRFFELFDEHQTRQAKIVAKIRCHPKDFKVRQMSKSSEGKILDGDEIPVAEELSLVVFTNDPGFFVMNNDPSCDHPRRSTFCPSLSWLHKPYRPDPEFTTVLDQDQFDRLLREEVAFKQALSQENEIRQRKLKERKDKID